MTLGTQLRTHRPCVQMTHTIRRARCAASGTAHLAWLRRGSEASAPCEAMACATRGVRRACRRRASWGRRSCRTCTAWRGCRRRSPSPRQLLRKAWLRQRKRNLASPCSGVLAPPQPHIFLAWLCNRAGRGSSVSTRHTGWLRASTTRACRRSCRPCRPSCRSRTCRPWSPQSCGLRRGVSPRTPKPAQRSAHLRNAWPWRGVPASRSGRTRP